MLKKVTWSLLIIALSGSAAAAQPGRLPRRSRKAAKAGVRRPGGRCRVSTRSSAMASRSPTRSSVTSWPIALTGCLGDAKPEMRDGIAFEGLSTWMRGGQLDLATLKVIRGDLLKMMARPDLEGFSSAFAALVLSEVARTDRLRAWMSADERDELIRAGALYLARVRDYRAFSDSRRVPACRGARGGPRAATRAQSADDESAARSHDARRGRTGRARGGYRVLGRGAGAAGAADRLHRAAEAAYRSGVAGASSLRPPIRSRSRRGKSRSGQSWASRSAITSARFS